MARKRSTARKSSEGRSTARKSSARKSSARKSTARKSTAGKSTAGKQALSRYRGRRNLAVSGEPGGGRPSKGDPLFVIQRHEATALHFDVRLEVDGVLVSWAVPKGPSTNPRERRLARRTEDHPMDYAHFEGAIAKGEYGAGTVIVWDTGTYRDLTGHGDTPVPMAEAVRRGHLTVWLDGQRLTGGYSFTRTRQQGEKEDWILVKVTDEYADRRRKPAKTQLTSVLSGRTNSQIAKESDG
jgi:DNA ligase D-like protein (predicted 3'-phosphoesterase)